MTKKRWTAEEKAKIVIEALTTSTGTADICKKYGLSPNTFYPWREKFLDGGKAALTGSPSARTIRTIQENATLKTLVGEITLANDALKKSAGGKERMMAVQKMVHQNMSLTKALKWCGVTRKRWYYKPKARKTAVDLGIAADYTTNTRGEAVLRHQKNGRGAVKKAGQPQADPAHLQKDGLESAKGDSKHAGSRSAQVDPIRYGRRTIHHVWCGSVARWCYYIVLDIFTRQWIAYRFSTLATADVAIESIVEAVSAAKPNCSTLTLQCDNGSQYAGKKFRKAMSLLGIRLTFIRTRTPEQNGHIESFHGTQLEYIWPHDFANYQEAEAVIAAAFRDYNQARLHSALKYVPPEEFQESWEAEHKRGINVCKIVRKPFSFFGVQVTLCIGIH